MLEKMHKGIVHFIMYHYLQLEPPEWTEWKEWGECTVTCGGRSQKRIRKCEDHICPDYFDCSGSNSQTQVCGEDCCPRKKFIPTIGCHPQIFLLPPPRGY